jgi:hypothetical protein
MTHMGMYKIHTEADLTLAEYKRREYRPVKVVRRTLYVLAGALLPSGLIVLEFEPWSERTNWLAGLAALVLFVGIEVSLLFGAYRSLARLISRLLGVTTLTAAFITMITGLCLIVPQLPAWAGSAPDRVHRIAHSAGDAHNLQPAPGSRLPPLGVTNYALPSARDPRRLVRRFAFEAWPRGALALIFYCFYVINK